MILLEDRPDLCESAQRINQAKRYTNREWALMASFPASRFTKGQIDRAGTTLRQFDHNRYEGDPTYAKEVFEAFEVVNDWRQSHGFPLNNFRNIFKSLLKRQTRDGFSAQRLKRMPTITSKLRMNPSMRLSRMQDIIGGLRGVVSSYKEILAVRDI